MMRQSSDAFLAITPLPEAEAEAGMAMSKVFKEIGSELCVGTGRR